ncbi:MAG: hypothetical protein ACOCQR_01875 [bacterium]
MKFFDKKYKALAEQIKEKAFREGFSTNEISNTTLKGLTAITKSKKALYLSQVAFYKGKLFGIKKTIPLNNKRKNIVLFEKVLIEALNNNVLESQARNYETLNDLTSKTYSSRYMKIATLYYYRGILNGIEYVDKSLNNISNSKIEY